MTTERKARLAKKVTAMPVLLPDVPPGFDWGWYSREDPRMHLQTVDEQHRNAYKVWLETRGHRTIEPATTIPSKVFKALKASITSNRQTIEDRWISFMIRQGWLQAHLAAPQVTLVAYPSTPNSFTRNVDLTQHLTEEEILKLTDADVRLSPERASLQIWPRKPEDQRQDVRLSTVLWEG
ncbi:MAG: hypothetical protein ACK4RK_09535 [Gemmataceae bacterium]